MSQRRTRGGSGPPGGSEGKRGSGPAAPPGRGRPLGFLAQLLVLAAAFGIGVGVAEAAGAANLGTAFGIGQMVFAITLLVLLLRA